MDPRGEHLVEHAAKRPHVAALVGRAALRLLRAHVGGGAENHALLCRLRGQRRRVCQSTRLGGRTAARSCFASPKSSTFTAPSAVSMMLAGFRSRWTIPCREPLRARRRFAGRTSALRRTAPGRARCGRERFAVHQLEHEESGRVRLLEPVDRPDVRMIQRGEQLRLALEARHALAIARRIARAES